MTSQSSSERVVVRAREAHATLRSHAGRAWCARQRGNSEPLPTKLALLLAVGLVGVCVSACGGQSRQTGSQTSQVPTGGSAAATTSSSPPTNTADGAKQQPSANDAGSIYDIPAYGHAATPATRREVTALVKRYYAAAAAGNGSAACAMLYGALAAAVPEDYGQAPGPTYARGKTCPVVLSKIFKHVSAQSAELAATEVIGVRVYGDRGFAELRSRATPDGEIFIEREHGAWKIGLLLGAEQP